MTDEGAAAVAPPSLLLDECLPRRLRRELAGYDVRTVQELGWAGTKNGALLSRAVDAGFGVFLTMDRSLEYQQHVPTVPLAIVLLRAPSNDIDDLRPLMPLVRDVLPSLVAGRVVRLSL